MFIVQKIMKMRWHLKRLIAQQSEFPLFNSLKGG